MTRPAALVAAAALALTAALTAAPATAAPTIHERFTDEFVSEIYDCDGIVAQDSGEVDVHLSITQRGSNPYVFFNEHAHGVSRTTNLITGGTFTNVFSSNSHDHTIVDNGDGTITITVHASGSSKFYDQNGKFVLKDPGAVWFQFSVFTQGTADPADDTDVPDSFEIVKSSTGNSDFSDRDYCADLATYTTP